MLGSERFAFARPTRWLVSDGEISLDGFLWPPLAVQTALWAGLLLVAATALIWSSSGRKERVPWSWLASGLVVVAGVLGYLTPFPWWPRVGFCQATGDEQFALDLNILFVIPWLSGMIALIANMSGLIRLPCPRCHGEVMPFRTIWLKSTLGRHRCPSCATVSGVRHPAWWWILQVLSWTALLGLGYRFGGLMGLISAAGAALVCDAFLDYFIIRRFHLLRPVEATGPEA